jgi:hypothetical protein
MTPPSRSPTASLPRPCRRIASSPSADSLSPKKIAVSLLFSHQAKNIVLSWTGLQTNYVLEGTTNLNSPSWSQVTNTPQLNGEQQSVTIVPATQRQFFRSRQQ